MLLVINVASVCTGLQTLFSLVARTPNFSQKFSACEIFFRGEGVSKVSKQHKQWKILVNGNEKVILMHVKAMDPLTEPMDRFMTINK